MFFVIFFYLGVCQLVNKMDEASGSVKAFNRNDEQFLEAFAIFCGLGIQNTQMYEAVERAMAKQEVTLEVSFSPSRLLSCGVNFIRMQEGEVKNQALRWLCVRVFIRERNTVCVCAYLTELYVGVWVTALRHSSRSFQAASWHFPAFHATSL